MTPQQIQIILEAAMELLQVIKDRDEDNTIELEDFFPRLDALMKDLRENRQARRAARKD